MLKTTYLTRISDGLILFESIESTMTDGTCKGLVAY